MRKTQTGNKTGKTHTQNLPVLRSGKSSLSYFPSRWGPKGGDNPD